MTIPNPHSYRNYYDWLAPKLSSEERKALDVIYEAANRSNGPSCQELRAVIKEICDMQLRNFGNATMTHIEFIALAQKGRGLLDATKD